MKIALVMRAAAFAAEAHKDQKRKSSAHPYLNHLIRVGYQASMAGLSPEAIAAAVLHDVVEDTPTDSTDLIEMFPRRVVELVTLLTQWWPDNAPESIKRREKPKYYAAILKDQEAIAIKLLDRADNLHEMARDVFKVRSWAKRYYEKSRVEISPLYDACKNKTARKVYAKSLGELRRALKLA